MKDSLRTVDDSMPSAYNLLIRVLANQQAIMRYITEIKFGERLNEADATHNFDGLMEDSDIIEQALLKKIIDASEEAKK